MMTTLETVISVQGAIFQSICFLSQDMDLIGVRKTSLELDFWIKVKQNETDIFGGKLYAGDPLKTETLDAKPIPYNDNH